MAVEAMFTCTQVVQHPPQGETEDMEGRKVPLQQHDVTFKAFAGGDHPYEENVDWSVYTPEGTIVMTVMNADAARYFVPGEDYRLEFTKRRPQQARE